MASLVLLQNQYLKTHCKSCNWFQELSFGCVAAINVFWFKINWSTILYFAFVIVFFVESVVALSLVDGCCTCCLQWGCRYFCPCYRCPVVPQPTCCWKLIFVTSVTIGGGVLFQASVAKITRNFGPFWTVLAILSQIDALFGVIFTGQKVRWCTKIDKYQVWLEVTFSKSVWYPVYSLTGHLVC